MSQDLQKQHRGIEKIEEKKIFMWGKRRKEKINRQLTKRRTT